MEKDAWQHKTILVDDHPFHVVEHGAGPTVMMLHGFPENWFAWRHQIDALSAAGYRAVAMDMRGYNQSYRPVGVRHYTTAELCKDVAGVIDQLGGLVHLVAHDWGGGVAWEFAARYPDRLRTLTIMNCPHPDAFIWHLRHNGKQLRRSWYMFFFQIPWLPEALFRANAKKIFTKALRGLAIRKEMFPDDVIDIFRDAMMQPGALTAGINYYRAAARGFFSRSGPLPTIHTPTQVIWADADEALGPELCDGLDRYVKGPLEVHHIPDCSHWVQQEQPETVNRLLIDFLSRQSR